MLSLHIQRIRRISGVSGTIRCHLKPLLPLMSVLPLTMLFIRAISALCLLSSRVVRPSSLSFSIYMSQILVLRLPGPLVSGLPLEALFLLGSSVTMRGPQIPGEVKHIAYTAPERPHCPYNGTTVRSDQGRPVPSWLPWCLGAF